MAVKRLSLLTLAILLDAAAEAGTGWLLTA